MSDSGLQIYNPGELESQKRPPTERELHAEVIRKRDELRAEQLGIEVPPEFRFGIGASKDEQLQGLQKIIHFRREIQGIVGQESKGEEEVQA